MFKRFRGVLIVLASLLAGLIAVKVTEQGTPSRVISIEAPVPVTVGKISAGSGLANTLSPGMRAMAIRVNEVSGVAGFVMPGDRVDVVERMTGRDTHVLIDGVRVLASAQDTDTHPHGPKTVTVVTLELSPAEVSRVLGRRQESELYLVLRRQEELKGQGEGSKDVHRSALEILRGTMKDRWERSQ